MKQLFLQMTIREAEEELKSSLASIYDMREAATIADWVMEDISGWKKADRIIHKSLELPENKREIFERFRNELLSHKPVQYVLHEAWFAGMKFYVDERVLIPRPETEELTAWVIADLRQQGPRHWRILDVGTGSGCIPITLKNAFPESEIFSCDISDEALSVARKNAADLNKSVHFMNLDFLNQNTWAFLPVFDCIVSNPPYISAGERESLAKNVSAFEPHLALFVPNEDPLIFYRTLADLSKMKLKPGGKIFAEVHEDRAEAVKKIFIEKSFSDIELKKDFQGKDRMIKATMLL